MNGLKLHIQELRATLWLAVTLTLTAMGKGEKVSADWSSQERLRGPRGGAKRKGREKCE